MKKLLWAFCALIILLSSCNKYLDLKSSNKMAVPVKLSDLQALLDDQTYMNNLRTPSMVQSYCDDSYAPDAVYAKYTADMKLQYQWKAVDYFFPNDWSTGYNPIYTSNYCLEQLANISNSASMDKEWNNVKGSALFYKAYYYLGLLWAFAPAYDPKSDNRGQGIVLRGSSDFNRESRFATVEEGYNEVINLATWSIDLLPDFPLVKTRPSKWAAYALLARAYLSMGRFEDAQKYATSALELNNGLIDFNNPDDGIVINANLPFTKFTKETIFYSEMTQKFVLHNPSKNAAVDTMLYRSYDTEDLRKLAYYKIVGKDMVFKGTHSSSINALFTGLSTAELFLISAESKIRNGDMVGGAADLNKLLKSRWNKKMPFREKVITHTASGLDEVLLERRKELLYRGLRWSDIKRLNLEGRNIILKRIAEGELVTLNPNSPMYQLPLPKDLEAYLK